MSSLFPTVAKLTGRVVLIVGPGEVVEEKISQLLDTGCAIRVVAPKATKQIQLWAKNRGIERKLGPFEPFDKLSPNGEGDYSVAASGARHSHS